MMISTIIGASLATLGAGFEVHRAWRKISSGDAIAASESAAGAALFAAIAVICVAMVL